MTALLGGRLPNPRKGSSGLTEVVGERVNYTEQERQCSLLARPLDRESGDLGCGPIPVTLHDHYSPWASVSPPIQWGLGDALGWPCLLILGQHDKSVNVTEHGQVSYMWDQPVTSRHYCFHKAIDSPATLEQLRPEHSIRWSICSEIQRSDESRQGQGSSRFSKGLKDFTGGPLRIIIARGGNVSDRKSLFFFITPLSLFP